VAENRGIRAGDIGERAVGGYDADWPRLAGDCDGRPILERFHECPSARIGRRTFTNDLAESGYGRTAPDGHCAA